jgi:hypothetical protein
MGFLAKNQHLQSLLNQMPHVCGANVPICAIGVAIHAGGCANVLIPREAGLDQENLWMARFFGGLPRTASPGLVDDVRWSARGRRETSLNGEHGRESRWEG